MPRSVIVSEPWSSELRVCTGSMGVSSKGGNFVQRMIARAREDGSLRMVADQCLQPTFTADLAAAIVAGVDAGATGVVSS